MEEKEARKLFEEMHRRELTEEEIDKLSELPKKTFCKLMHETRRLEGINWKILYERIE